MCAIGVGWALAWPSLLALPAWAGEFPSLYSGLSDNPDSQEVAFPEADLSGAACDGDRYIYEVQDANGKADLLEVGAAEIDSDGLVQAWGGVTLTLTSLVEGRTASITANSATYDQTTGEVWLDGEVQVALSGTELTVQCSTLAYDPGMQRLDVTGLELAAPLSQLLNQTQMPDAEPRAELPGHFLGLPPEGVWLAAAQAHFEQRADETVFVLAGARITHSSHPDPDLFVSANEVYLNGEQITLRGVAVEISGITLGRWPQYTLPTGQEHRLYSFGIPTVNVGGDGVAWRQPVSFDFGEFKTDLLLDYSEDYELLTHGYTYATPAEGLELGIEYGDKAQVDINRVGYVRYADYNLRYRQRFNEPFHGIRQLRLSGEYGEMTYKTDGSAREGVPPGEVSDTRALGRADVEFALTPLGGGLYFTSGLSGRYIEYDDANRDYRVLSGRAGFIFRQGRFDNFVLYQANDSRGNPVFAPDAVRAQEVEFATSVRLFPQWRHVVQGVYDVGDEEMHTLQVSALKRLNSYELGAYWDFVRETAGVEIGLILD